MAAFSSLIELHSNQKHRQITIEFLIVKLKRQSVSVFFIDLLVFLKVQSFLDLKDIFCLLQVLFYSSYF
jgi:hypothetical protein